MQRWPWATLLLATVFAAGCDDAETNSGPATVDVLAVADSAGSTDAAAGTDATTATDAAGSADVLVIADVVFGAPCTLTATQLLGPIEEVSTGEVKVLATDGLTRTLYVDASAGGFSQQGANPRLYLNLETAQRVDVTDAQAVGTAAWDLALKRPVLYSNGGTAGPGVGKAGFVFKAFDQVTAADEALAELTAEEFWDASCKPAQDQLGAPLTTMTDWYDLAAGGATLEPKNVTFVIQGGTGKRYKLKILDYYANPDGSKGTTSGRYVLKVAPL